MPSSNKNRYVAIRDGETQKWVNLPAGEYLVEEYVAAADISGYYRKSWFSGYEATDDGLVMVTAAAVEVKPGTNETGYTVPVVNEYIRQTGDLVIEKIFSGYETALTDEQAKALSFTIEGPDDFKAVTTTYDFFTNGKLTLELTEKNNKVVYK